LTKSIKCVIKSVIYKYQSLMKIYQTSKNLQPVKARQKLFNFAVYHILSKFKLTNIYKIPMCHFTQTTPEYK
jgi:hypothetical protein